MSDLPRISIVTPSYNQGAFIEQTIRSVLDQEYPDLEYIVIDGGSNDNSVDIIRKYSDALTSWVSEPDRGQSHAINKGFAQASGDIFGWLNSDDRLEPGCLEVVADAFMRNPETGVFVGHGRKVDTAGETVYYKKPDELTFERLCGWMNGGNFMQPSCFFRRSAWESAGPLDEDIHIAMDVDLWLRMIKKVEFRPIDRLLSSAVAHEAAKTTADINRMVVDCSLVVARAGGDRFVRERLESLADQLTRCEDRYQKLVQHPLVRFMKPLLRRIYKLTA